MWPATATWSTVRALVVGALVASVSARAEPPTAPVPAPREPSRSPTFAWVPRPVTMAHGEEGELTVDLLVPEGFHVFRDDVRLTVLDDAGLTVRAPLFPEPVRPADGGEPRYERDVRLTLPVGVVRVEPGVHLVQLVGEVRGCSASKCHDGAREAIEVFVQVVARDEASCPR